MSADDARRPPEFARRFRSDRSLFTRIGDGELGGKAAGLELVKNRVLGRLDEAEFPGLRVEVPSLTVLTTELFESFIERNGLAEIALSDAPDDRIALAFQKASLPAEFVGDLRALITEVHTPLAVRSSSLLEDALAHPFAGVFETKLIPANQPDADTRFRKLVEAIKFVWASTFFRSAKNYIRGIGQDLSAERMAVVIQAVVGARHGDRFYPTLSGVARSYNYYAFGHGEPEDGVLDLALGLGKQIVDGGLCWSISPAYPKAPPPFGGAKDLLDNTQRRFWAVNMGAPPPPDPIHETEFLLELDLDAAEYDGALRHVASTFDPASERLRAGVGAKGIRVLDFAPLLRGGGPPLVPAVRRLLALAAEALGAAVEIEFAVEFGDRPESPARFGFLQARPMLVPGEAIALSAGDLEGERTIVASDQALGNGVREGLADVVFLKPEAFDIARSRDIARELETVNRGLVDAGRHYLLVGFGRWGSSDPWLGVPVDWGQIGNARVIVEATLPDLITDMSQGSHFFHNLIGFGVLYLSVRHTAPRGIDWEWLAAQETAAETPFVRHVRLREPLTARVDGRQGLGVIERVR